MTATFLQTPRVDAVQGMSEPRTELYKLVQRRSSERNNAVMRHRRVCNG
jgi:hypothetical protein